jgi:hypothetical protein
MTLIHYGANKYDPTLVKPILNAWVKPRGGLWTSPVDSEYGWKDWCEGENYGHCDESNSFRLQLKSDARILKIDSLEDLLKLPMKDFNGLPSKYPDFECLSKKYDAIWLTVDGQNETRHSFPNNLYGWDCESVLILNPNCCFQI